MNEELAIEYSPLCQSISCDDKTIDIEIYAVDQRGWILEVFDEYENSLMWAEPFDSDQEALDEVLLTIEEDGIDALIGPPPTIH